MSINSIVKYYDNGNINLQYTLVDGLAHGEFKKYHDNGKLKEQRTYVNSLIEGKTICYHRNGQVKIVVWYKDGKLQSLQNKSN